MVKKSKGFRVDTRKKLTQKMVRPTITRFLQDFVIGQKVTISLEPSSQKGMPFPRFSGKFGRIVGRRGKSYIVEVKDLDKVKKVISRPEHLKAVQKPT